MHFFKQKINGLRKRFQWATYGVKYNRSNSFVFPSALLVNGQRKQINFPDSNSRGFLYEFDQICLEDCYQLSALKGLIKKVENIVDVGANQGIFLVAARQHFPKAAICSYEPNIDLKTVLDHNAKILETKVYYEAVTRETCKVELHFGETHLHTVSRKAVYGTVEGTSLRMVLQRAGNKIDILKLDCEGAEWELLEDTHAWKNIKSVTMEYHLWAKPGSSYGELSAILDELGYSIIAHKPLSETFGLLTAVRRQQ